MIQILKLNIRFSLFLINILSLNSDEIRYLNHRHMYDLCGEQKFSY